MEAEANTSHDVNDSEVPDFKSWTRNLQSLPAFTYELLTKHLGTGLPGTGTLKHKKVGYQLFKDKYVSQVHVKPNVMKGNASCFLVKCSVNAAMRSNTYNVYVHLSEDDGDVVYANCSCIAGKGGQCKHVVALLFQVIEYKQLDMTDIPDHPTCTQLLQQWHVPRKDESNEPVLYENILFQKAIYDKNTCGKKRKHDHQTHQDFNPTPHFARTIKPSEIGKLSNSLMDNDENSYLGKLLKSNDNQPYPYEHMHQKLPSKKYHAESMHENINDVNVRDKILAGLQPFIAEESNIDCEVVNNLKRSHTISYSQVLEIEKYTRKQSLSETWFHERQKRLTSSNFGAVVKRRKQRYPKSLIGKIKQPKFSNCTKPCQWGKDKEGKAIEEYLKSKMNDEKNVSVCANCGFVVNAKYPWLGASPDFLVIDSSEEKPFGIGEVKCPHSKKDVRIDEACNDKNFFLEKLNGQLQLKKTHNYFYQIQGCMATLNVS